MVTPSNILNTIPTVRLPSITRSMQAVAQHHGVSVARQLREMIALRYGPGKLLPQEYYRFHLYRRSLTRAQKRDFIGDAEAHRLNLSLTAPERAQSRYAIEDKLTLLSLCKVSAIPATPIQAVYSNLRRIGPWPHIASYDALAHFLLHDAQYPLFGKPAVGRQSVGGVQIERLDDDGHLRLFGDVQGPHATDFAAEVIAKFSAGYLFQDCARTADELRGLAPDAIGPLRVITTLGAATRPNIMFACFRLPVHGTDSGQGMSKSRIFAQIDIESHEICSAIDRTNGMGRAVETQAHTGQKLIGFKINQLPAAFELAQRAHLLSPDVGIVGWDIAVTNQGPLIMEGNTNPAYTHAQFTEDRGVLGPSYGPQLAAIKAHADALSAAFKAGKQHWELGALRETIALERTQLKR